VGSRGRWLGVARPYGSPDQRASAEWCPSFCSKFFSRGRSSADHSIENVDRSAAWAGVRDISLLLAVCTAHGRSNARKAQRLSRRSTEDRFARGSYFPL